MIVQQQWIAGRDRCEHDARAAAAAADVQVAVAADINQVGADAGDDIVVGTGRINRVVATASDNRIVAGTQIESSRTVAADVLVIAGTAEVADTAGRTTGKGIVTVTTADNTAGTGIQNSEIIVASTTVEVQQRGHAAIDKN